MHKLMIAAALFLASCTQPAPSVQSRFRAADAPIWSNAQLDGARMTGRWRQVAAFVNAGRDCAPGGADISGTQAALTLVARLCQDGREAAFSGPLDAIGPGRFRAEGQEWWVIWVDTDYRTLAIGTPSGAFGFILNRGGPLPPDRLRAARTIFEFNGYDTERLRVF